ncbi:glycoside hydrolase family 2 protein [Pinibacter aurantiacus]|uniref:beta-galactosidase n=1 Tax=Pinibacter aurantiacus TaxID=2851599 RepID=A0A9E2SA31_9BACT|nr:glycoside hydrolase family 2 TIM barrel-domain containing protein [Pinibacter aurantiacus]MBV4357532.1 glycoside hydrolase family 2 [Pinibacter aurantiacus]
MKNVLTVIFSTAMMLIFSGTQGQEKQIQYLSGTANNHTVTWNFYCTGGRNSGKWTTIQVPSCWEQQGFGTYNYGRDYKTYGSNFRFADEKGLYKYSFAVPKSWTGKVISIVFEGSMTDTEVKINGVSAGVKHRGAFYEFRYDITDKIKFGSANVLEVTVSKMSDDASVNNAERLADYWVFGGIFRPVYLEAVEQQHIERTAIDAKASGDLTMQVFTKNVKKANKVVADIIDKKGNKVATITKTVSLNDTAVLLQTKVNSPLTWTSETPELYSVNFYLKEGDKTVFRTKEKFGFRTIEVRHGDGIYINGVQVKMKGVNRHCWWPETARTLNDSIQLMDVQLIKQMNMNAVRCSHYPPDKRFLELCDSLGLYVLDELAGWQKAYSTKAGEPLVRELVIRDVNHPSIIFWDNGNEGGTNKELDDDFDKWDISHRPVIHPHHRPGNQFNGIDCNHYEDYYSTKNILNDSLIYMPTEFLHSQDDGGGGAAMDDFWELHWHAKRSGGGFIWAMLDEGVVRTDMNNIIDANGLNANDGIMGPHREKEGSFYALKEIFCPVHVEMKSIPDDFNGSIELENRYHFTNLNECKYQWMLVNFAKPFDMQSRGYEIVKQGWANVPSILPLQKGKINLGLPADFKQYEGLVLRVTDKFNNVLNEWTWKLQSNKELLPKFISSTDKVASVAKNDSVITLKGGDVTVELDTKTGLLKKVVNGKASALSFNNGPVMLNGKGTVIDVKAFQEGSSSIAEFKYAGDIQAVKWTMAGNGWLTLDYTYSLTGKFDFAGISFSYPENYVLGTRWLGKGPYRQWKNRMKGTPVNVWQNFYNNTQTSYWPMVYPEFKGYYGDISWMEFNTIEGRFYVVSQEENLFVRLFDFYGITGPEFYPKLPAGNISFLDCIPPIGTKLAVNITKNAAVYGPQSELTEMSKPVTRKLYFYFGLPAISKSNENYSRPSVDNVF